jgi:putative ABC transport system permease protein
MLTIAFSFRHLLRHWRLNLVVFLGLTMLTGLLAGLPAYAVSVAAASLDQALADASSATRNIQLAPAGEGDLTIVSYRDLEAAIGEVIDERVVVLDQKAALGMDPRWVVEMVSQGKTAPQFVHFWSFDNLHNHVRVVDGRLPRHVPPRNQAELFHPPGQEIAIGSDASAETGLGVGDMLVTSKFDGGIELEIVGIVEPLDPYADVWWNDTTPFGVTFTKKSATEYDTVLSAFASAETLRAYFQPREHWRLLIDRRRITVENAGKLRDGLSNASGQLRSREVALMTGLIGILEAYQADLATARVVLFLLSTQSLFFVLYVVWMLADLLMERSQGEWSLLASRGAGWWQVSRVSALEGVILAGLASLSGPLVSHGILSLWTAWRGARIPAVTPAESWLLAFLGGFLGWVVLALSAALAARRNVVAWQRRLARPERRAAWQKVYLDVFLLALGGLAYWQLSQSGSLLVQALGETAVADPLLLLSPSLLLVAVGLVFLRLFPQLLRLVTGWAKRGRGLILPMGMMRLARKPLGPSRVVLLISLALGLALFANTFGHSAAVRQREMAHFLSGADLVISPSGSDPAGIAALPGVRAVSPAVRTSGITLEGSNRSVLAIDSETLPLVAGYPEGISDHALPELLSLLAEQSGGETVPAIFGSASVSPHARLGDVVAVRFGGQTVRFEVRAIVDWFPSMPPGRFVVTELETLGEWVDLERIVYARGREVWLDVDPGAHSALAAELALEGRVRADAAARLREMEADAFIRGVVEAFRLNVVVLAVLSMGGFLIVTYFAAQQRGYEIGILRAIGLADGQLLWMLVVDSVLAIGLGLAAGTAMGVGLSALMLPYLSPVLEGVLAGGGLARVAVDWAGVLRLYAVLLGCYGVMVLVLLISLRRLRLLRALRLGEE